MFLQIFDPTLVKKKKKKKTTFDLDAALAETEPQQDSTEPSSTSNEPIADQADDTANLDDLDLENFGKKKKKKKKIGFNLDDLEQALPDDENANEGGEDGDDMGFIDDTFGMKKKKKKTKDISELLKDNKENEEAENGKKFFPTYSDGKMKICNILLLTNMLYRC